MKTQLKSALKWAFYGILAVGAVILTVTHPKEMFIGIAAAPFCFIGIYSFVKAFKRTKP